MPPGGPPLPLTLSRSDHDRREGHGPVADATAEQLLHPRGVGLGRLDPREPVLDVASALEPLGALDLEACVGQQPLPLVLRVAADMGRIAEALRLLDLVVDDEV